MLVEEIGDLLEHLLRFRGGVVADVVRVRHALIDLKRGLDAGLPKLAVNANGVAQQQVARAAGQPGCTCSPPGCTCSPPGCTCSPAGAGVCARAPVIVTAENTTRQVAARAWPSECGDFFIGRLSPVLGFLRSIAAESRSI